MQTTHGNRSHLHRAGSHRLVGLYVVSVFVFLQQVRAHEELESLAHLGSAHLRAASTGHREGLRPRHRRRQLTQHRIFPVAKVPERIPLQNFRLVAIRDGKHPLEHGFLGGIRSRTVKKDHLAKIILLVTQQTHRIGDAPCRIVTQVELALAHIFKVNRRGKSRLFGEPLPAKRGSRLPVGVVIRDILTVVRIFEYIFHFSS